jgi:hypothetical protein
LKLYWHIGSLVIGIGVADRIDRVARRHFDVGNIWSRKLLTVRVVPVITRSILEAGVTNCPKRDVLRFVDRQTLDQHGGPFCISSQIKECYHLFRPTIGARFRVRESLENQSPALHRLTRIYPHSIDGNVLPPTAHRWQCK